MASEAQASGAMSYQNTQGNYIGFGMAFRVPSKEMPLAVFIGAGACKPSVCLQLPDMRLDSPGGHADSFGQPLGGNFGIGCDFQQDPFLRIVS